MQAKLNRVFGTVFFLWFCLLPAFNGSFWVNHAWGSEEYAAEFSVSPETLPADDPVLETSDTIPETGALVPEAVIDDNPLLETAADAERTATGAAGDDADDFDPDEEWYEPQNNTPALADPIEPFNRAMYHFNDKMYFWVLKPVAIGYNTVVPELVRVGVKNFFTNLTFPVRFTSSLLQADFKGVLRETGRFGINTTIGLIGFFDLATSLWGDIFPKDDADLGETFGIWGIGPGIYIVWPVFGPSSIRDTFATVGETFLYPPTYLHPWYVSPGVRSYQIVNDTSLRLGDYEALMGAAIDPYLSMRDVYIQYRAKKIENKRRKLSPPGPEEP